MTDWNFSLDTQIVFGQGARAQLSGLLPPMGDTVLLVTGRSSFEHHPCRSDVLAGIERSGARIVGQGSARGEPDDGAVIEVAEQAIRNGANVLVAVGGGSALDLAKAAALVAAGAEIETLLRSGRRVDHPGLPVVALPTTAGSGAEVSRGAVILDRAARRKRGIRGRGVAPRVAIVDPELVIPMDARVTAESGFDAMAHAVETAVSHAASPITALLAGEAIRQLLHAVPASIANPTDATAREACSLSALMMGVNLATSTTCLPHRLQYPVGGVTGTSHASGVAALFPAWMRRTLVYGRERLAELAWRSGVSDAGDGADALVARIEVWMDDIGMRPTLSELGVTERTIPDLVAMVEGSLESDPGPTTPRDLEQLYRDSL